MIKNTLSGYSRYMQLSTWSEWTCLIWTPGLSNRKTTTHALLAVEIMHGATSRTHNHTGFKIRHAWGFKMESCLHSSLVVYLQQEVIHSYRTNQHA
jgi:hypothetical protein